MQNPKLIPVPFANSGIKDDIPKVKSTSMSDEKASWETGFPEATMLPVYAGGLPPDGRDVNGVLNQISENLVFQSKGGRYKFDPDFALSIGGYPKGATLQSNDESAEYQSLIDDNLVNFNTATPEEIAQSWRITGIGDATEVLNSKFDKASVKNELGLSTTEVVSQKVVTELGSGIVGSFESGLNFIEELTNSDQQVTLENEFGKQTYCWTGNFPKKVTAGSTPESTGGIEKGAWVRVSGTDYSLLAVKTLDLNVFDNGQLRIGTMPPSPAVGGERDTLLLTRDIQGESDRHGFRDESVLSNITDHGTYGTFDAAVIYRGDNFYGHNFSFQDRFRYQGSGGVKLHGGLLSAPNYSGTGIIYERNGLRIQEYDGTSVVNTQIAIKIDALDKAKSNYTLVSDSPKASMLHTGVAIYGYPKKAPNFTEGLVYQGNWLVGGKQTGIRSEGSANKACFESYKAFSAKLQTTPEANVPDLIGYDVNTGGAANNASVSRIVGFNFTEYNQIALSVRGIQLAVNAEEGKNNWQIFVAGTAPNWINSRTGFGVDNEARAPKARVDIQGSTETEAQLRLREGVLTANPLNGFIEFNGSDLYITIKGIRKKFVLE
ncbi:hypothetical protein [Providencia sp. Je.9.19]|uniref:tail fiber/spike domain-containing protein n=1 Tax=Providencia sp. Je.9.19 TaxID=3142844 RepID=UPI003DAA1B36